MPRFLRSILFFLCSLQLAVWVILTLAGALAVATLVESAYDTPTAQFWIYQARWFYALLALLAVNIFCVALQRLPWKKSHLPFLLAHAGILFVLLGSWITQRAGLDGTLTITEGETTQAIELDAASFVIAEKNQVSALPIPWIPPHVSFRAMQVASYGLPYSFQVDGFLSHADTEVSFYPAQSAQPNQKKFAAIQFQVVGGPMGRTEPFWLWEGSADWKALKAGPAEFFLGIKNPRMHLQQSSKEEFSVPSIAFFPDSHGTGFRYEAQSSTGTVQRGHLSLVEGQTGRIRPGWKSEVAIEVLRWIPHAQRVVKHRPAQIQWGKNAPPSAIHVSAAENIDLWLGLGERAVVHWGDREVSIGYLPKKIMLPFSVKLKHFKITRDPGTQNPAGYESEIQVEDATGLKDITVSMNTPFEAGGYTLYQASYEEAEPRPTTSIFSVNRDPGRFLKYFGSLCVVLGSIWLFAIKYRKKRLKEKGSTMDRTKGNQQLGLALIGGVLCLGGALSQFPRAHAAGHPAQQAVQSANQTKAQQAEVPVVGLVSAAPTKGNLVETVSHLHASFREMALVPIQSGGRVKPFDSFAREILLFETSARSYQNWDPVELLLSWIAAPLFWEKQRILYVGREDVRRQLHLDPARSLFTPEELFANVELAQFAHRLELRPQTKKNPLSDSEREMQRVLERVHLFQGLLSGESWLLVPRPEPTPWGSVAEDVPAGKWIREQFIYTLQAYQAGDADFFERSARFLRTAVEGEIPHFESSFYWKFQAEYLYHRSRPFLLAWVFYLGAALGFLFYGQTQKKQIQMQSLKKSKSSMKKSWAHWVRRGSWGAMGCASAAHLFGIILRCIIADRPPVTNMYESVIWVSFGVIVFAMILFILHRQVMVLSVASFLALLGLIAGDAAPAVLDPSIHPLVPVLRSNYWLTVHVLTITLSYAAFALTFGLANVTLFQFLRRAKPQVIAHLNQVTYRAMQFGVVLIAAGTILGGIWADYSWGRFWGWDPKEVWALITLLCYLVILHGRYAQWFGPFGFAVGSSLAFLSVIMAWYGVNFILGAGLHSYGFATGGTLWVGGFVLIQLAYVLLTTGFYFQVNRKNVT